MTASPSPAAPNESSSTTETHPFLIDYPFGEIIAAYPPGIIRLYCHIRAHILRSRILAEVGQYVPAEGKVLELGCGFGLFGNAFALTHPNARFTCIDLNERRIGHARKAAEQLGIHNVEFHFGDATEAIASQPPQRCIYMLDLIHHLPSDSVETFIRACWDRVEPGGKLIVKDVADRPWFKCAFTWLLDVMMTKGKLPHYLSVQKFLAHFGALGAQVSVHCLDDYLPFPHVLYICRKPR